MSVWALTIVLFIGFFVLSYLFYRYDDFFVAFFTIVFGLIKFVLGLGCVILMLGLLLLLCYLLASVILS
ncbi:hypothetical protein B0680_03240 [Moraxella pluranimalium]|uniref:Uncharacterized protein n=1 Tax=Moraxella pluranimalium TaxID=470453 RepID=A0A1T0CS32_9GAMM|nr:hypothetical protein B0680_03240 [Moraxella pluranimalium]